MLLSLIMTAMLKRVLVGMGQKRGAWFVWFHVTVAASLAYNSLTLPQRWRVMLGRLPILPGRGGGRGA